MEASEQIKIFQEFLETNYHAQLLEQIRKGDNFFVIDFLELSKFNPEIADLMLDQPEDVIRAAEIAVEQFDLPKPVTNFRIRVKNLPNLQQILIRNIRSTHIGKFLSVQGIVRQKSDVRPQVTSSRFECPSCGNIISVLQLEQKFKEPSRCGCGRKGKFRLLSKELIDVQRISLEEAAEDLEGGEQPKRMNVFLKEDLVSPLSDRKTNPGSKILVNGLVKEVPITLRSGSQSTRFDLLIEANYVEPIQEDFYEMEISEEEEKAILELAKDPKIVKKLISSVAPSIYGYDKIKEALILQLVGGVKKTRSDGVSTRGDMHVLLIGDPGSGKSQLLKRMSKVAPKCRFVSGKGVSGAGLCITGDSLVLTNPGEIDEIKTMVEENIKANYEEYPPGILKSKKNKKSCKVFSINKNGEIITKTIDSYWKIKSPKKLLKIRTQSGREIISTPNTRLCTLSNGELMWNKAQKFKVGDYIATSRKIPEIENKNKTYLLEIIDTEKMNPIVYNAENDVDRIIKKLMRRHKTKRNIAKKFNISEDSIYYRWVRKDVYGNINLKTLKILANAANYPLKNIKNFELSLYMGHRIKIPEKITKEFLYFAALIAGDGDLSKGENSVCIKFSNNNKILMKKFKTLSKSLFNVNVNVSSIKSIKRPMSLRFSSKIVAHLLNKFGIPNSPKSHRINPSNLLLNIPKKDLAYFIKGLFDCDGSVIKRKTRGSNYIDFTTTSEKLAKKLQLILERFEIHAKLREKKVNFSIETKIKSKYKKYVLEIMGKKNLIKFKDDIGFNHSIKKQKLIKIIQKTGKSNTNIDIIPNIQGIIIDLKNKYKIKSRKLFGYKKSTTSLHNFQISRDYLNKLVKNFSKYIKNNNEKFKKLCCLATNNIFWDKIISKKIITKSSKYIYDLTVPEIHNFLVNGIFVHNTATVMRDEFLGGWTLEAGALPLCNKGFCMIDEIDKMSAEDRSAMHEGLEQQTISISKANIQATLRCETTVLAAANPKFGRFDPYEILAKQFDLAPALINRFDLIFAIKDMPDEARDKLMAKHILSLHQNPDIGEAEISTELLKKYISYARQKCKPILTDSALERIKEFYIKMRMSGSEEGRIKTVAISPRQLEALVRLSEASAKLRLSPKVLKKDAERAIEILHYCLSQIGIDPETGKIDIDRIASGITASQRGKISIIKEIILELENKLGKVIPIEDIINEAEAQDISRDKAEEVIERLKRSGDLFEPRRGWLSRI